jgi:FtsH-binding integral membrane protein
MEPAIPRAPIDRILACKMDLRRPCMRVTLLLLLLQTAFIAVTAWGVKKNPRVALALSTSRTPWYLVGACAALIGGLVLFNYNPVLGWVLFTTGAAAACGVFVQTKSRPLIRALLLSTAVLGGAFLFAPLTTAYFADPRQDPAVAAVIVVFFLLVVSVAYPPSGILDCISMIGAAVFSVWTVRDVAVQDCEEPLRKSVSVFLDLLNVVGFTAAAP